ncbi:hypothetical protein B0H17DRAFT_1335527 [Mycena rosella]|uniref:Uncharacterized protein n=1 Tax=Mycena rosella TaxID=1033263 RepID=A0AAD7CZC1_MYCRO|nr:hypothetical protein B0H17DRAFT_1335527 [Mycena rosella]
MGRHSLPSLWLDLLLVLGSLVTTGRAKYVPLLQPGFFFDYNIASQPVPIPITEQCETIHIKWGRQGAIGPNPVAPYSLVVYTSTFITPFTIAAGSALSFDWDVPFAPGTQYQICMWDKNGVPGGCQSMYTVVQNATVATPTCQNVTFPTLLDVDATVPGGPLSQYGFINQCTDLSLTPKSGKPPFTLTVAPALHPPYNITSNSMDPIDWTVSLSWAFPFFLSLVSSDGQMWSNGPLHAGGFGPSDCLAPGTISNSKAHALAVGAGVGGAFGAGIFGALVTFLFLRYRHKIWKSEPKIEAFDFPPRSPEMAYTRDRAYSESNSEPLSQTTVSDSRTFRTLRTSHLPSTPAPQRNRTTYVLHHDAGQAPVTVITDAEEVVELPPRYQTDRPLPVVREKAEPEEQMRLASSSPLSSFASSSL